MIPIIPFSKEEFMALYLLICSHAKPRSFGIIIKPFTSLSGAKTNQTISGSHCPAHSVSRWQLLPGSRQDPASLKEEHASVAGPSLVVASHRVCVARRPPIDAQYGSGDAGLMQALGGK